MAQKLATSTYTSGVFASLAALTGLTKLPSTTLTGKTKLKHKDETKASVPPINFAILATL